MFVSDRWRTFSQRDQIGHIGAELLRAGNAGDNADLRRALLERALDLIDASLDDPKWRANPLPMLTLRGEVAKAYVGATDPAKIYATL